MEIQFARLSAVTDTMCVETWCRKHAHAQRRHGPESEPSIEHLHSDEFGPTSMAVNGSCARVCEFVRQTMQCRLWQRS
jgi:hypothetical protein